MLHKCQSLFPLTITPTNNKHGIADCYLWQQKALFLNGNLAEKRQADSLGMLAHLPLAYFAQSLPPAQSDSRLCLLTMPASPLLGSRPGCLLLQGVLAAWPSFPTSLDLCLSLIPSPPNVLSSPPAYISPSLAAAFPATCPIAAPHHVLSWSPQDNSPSGLLHLSPLSSPWPPWALSFIISSNSGSPPSLRVNKTLR